MKSKLSKVVVSLLVMSMILAATTPMEVQAASKKSKTYVVPAIPIGVVNNGGNVPNDLKDDKWYQYTERVALEGGLNHLMDENGNLRPSRTIKRYEFTMIALELYGYNNPSLDLNQEWFTTQAATKKWANGVITKLSGGQLNWKNNKAKGNLTRGEASYWYYYLLMTKPR
ncbi:MAG: hypothetical protein Q4E47_00290 [Candidatus Saccharibacteria bacterium]|nr:hypothetical protein [Candidatus Saccharibacteria bacterium]